MNYSLALITLAILSWLIYFQIKIWKTRAFMSPGFYFACIWFFGVLGCVILYPAGLFYEVYPQYVDELNILVSFTALCFLFFTKKGRDKVNPNTIKINYFTRLDLFTFLSIIFLLAAISEFIRLGGNLNMGAAREHLHANMKEKPVIIGYAQTLSIPLSIYSGYIIIKTILNKNKLIDAHTLRFFIPLLGNLIFSITMGGRVNFVYAFTSYLIGASLALPLNKSLREIKKPLLTICGGMILVLVFITAVANQRQEHYNGESNEMEVYLKETNPLLGAIFGPIQYVHASYVGYQHRRIDAVDETHLGYGQYTFNGFINWTLPFAGIVGLGNISIAKYLGIYYHNQETYDFEREYYYTTHSGYLTMIKDFGFWGTLICIFFLVMLSHKLFVKVQMKKNIKYVSVIFFFFIFWEYWAKSNFYGTLSSTLLVPFYGFLIIDMCKYFYWRKK